jgi:hypothetical protein
MDEHEMDCGMESVGKDMPARVDRRRDVDFYRLRRAVNDRALPMVTALGVDCSQLRRLLGRMRGR